MAIVDNDAASRGRALHYVQRANYPSMHSLETPEGRQEKANAQRFLLQQITMWPYAMSENTGGEYPEYQSFAPWLHRPYPVIHYPNLGNNRKNSIHQQCYWASGYIFEFIIKESYTTVKQSEAQQVSTAIRSGLALSPTGASQAEREGGRHKLKRWDIIVMAKN